MADTNSTMNGSPKNLSDSDTLSGKDSDRSENNGNESNHNKSDRPGFLKGRWSDPQTIAWTVVIGSFILFCALCAVGTFAVYWFLFQSATPLDVQLVVSRGVVTIIHADGTSQAVTTTTDLNPGSIIQIASNSQGYLTFKDNGSNQQIGTLFILGNSSVTLSEALRPRFEWSKQNYGITLNDVNGHFVAEIPDQLNRLALVNINSSIGTVHVEGTGTYSIDAIDPQLSIFTMTGKAFLYNTVDSSKAQQVFPTFQGTLTAQSSDIQVRPYPFDMMDLPDMGPPQPIFKGDTLPLFWGCGSEVQNTTEPLGDYRQTVSDELPALQIVRRRQATLGPAKTMCRYWFPPYGLHPDQYTSVSIQLKMKIDYQDVPTCGIVGSECPIMLLVDYIDKNNNEQVWRQGFYSVREPSDAFVRRCDTCFQEHAQINLGTWYIYDTGDLKNLFPKSAEIDYIRYVEVYASGHQFDVSLNQIMVLAGKGTELTPAS